MVHIITLVYKTQIFTLLVCSLIAPLVQVEIANHLELIATLISINITYFLSITPWFPSYLNVKRDQL